MGKRGEADGVRKGVNRRRDLILPQTLTQPSDTTVTRILHRMLTFGNLCRADSHCNDHTNPKPSFLPVRPSSEYLGANKHSHFAGTCLQWRPQRQTERISFGNHKSKWRTRRLVLGFNPLTVSCAFF